jgi:Major Facilitator Superfamily.
MLAGEARRDDVESLASRRSDKLLGTRTCAKSSAGREEIGLEQNGSLAPLCQQSRGVLYNYLGDPSSPSSWQFRLGFTSRGWLPLVHTSARRLSVEAKGSRQCSSSRVMTYIYLIIIFRVLQDIGVSGIYFIVIIIVTNTVPPEKYNKYIGIVLTLFIVASVLGPILGGIINIYSL